jgi:hypothetical protein
MSAPAEDAAGAGLPDEVLARIPIAKERARLKSEAASPSTVANALLDAAVRARTRPQRVVWLQRWGSAWVAPLAASAACRRGCSHCCHIPVSITSAEARVIGAATGKAVAAPAGLTCGDLDLSKVRPWEVQQRRFIGQPCPFLSGSECSIYDSRPFACRVHVSLDDDAFLCRLVPGLDVPAPYVNTTQVRGIFIGSQPGETLADLREFFPG